ncbi:MAG: cyclic peptide export transporter [Rhodospirillales bacterium]|nr:cyclic peptide export transporter [Rhodospirillales bacterium]
MELLRLLDRGFVGVSRRRMLMMLVVAGIANALILVVINSAAEHAAKSDTDRLDVLLFVAVMAIYVLAQRFVMTKTAAEVEQLIHQIRVRLIDRVRTCELRDLEEIGRARIYGGVRTDTQTMSQAATPLVLALQSAVLIFFATLYLISLSLTAFALAVAFMSLAVTVYLRKTARVSAVLQEAQLQENALHDELTGLLDGFKEVKMNSRRSVAVQEEVDVTSARAAALRTSAQTELARNFIFAQSTFYLLLGTMVFLVPMLSSGYSDVVVKTTTAVLFLIGPISGLVANVPVFNNANIAAANIIKLDEMLAGPVERAQLLSTPNGNRRAFREIVLRGVVFQHRDNHAVPFAVGPIDLTLRAGEIVFLTGGNGSGKSTLLKLLTALYLPQLGSIQIDGELVTPVNAQSYRDMFATVFSDFHLFRKLHGVDFDSPDEVQPLIDEMELTEKTALVDRAFNTVDLSAGQRKRLALLVAMLERRPICILDEWAADQDPIFRRKFYYEILPILRARGATIIAVTHDDRYFHLADRQLRMEEGKLLELASEAVA